MSKYPDWWPPHCEWLQDATPCLRPATEEIDGWNDMPVCHGHGMQGRFNKSSWGYEEMSVKQQEAIKDMYVELKAWFKDNPNESDQ